LSDRNEVAFSLGGHALELHRKDTGYRRINNRLSTELVEKRAIFSTAPVDDRFPELFVTN
jgi:hypothetical protein